MRCPIDCDSGGASRDAFVHGPTVCTNTRRPPKAPASRRSGVAPSSGRVPVQAARVSVATSGVHSGVAAVKRSRGQRTASKTICQSIAAAAGRFGACGFGAVWPGVRCGGTAWNSRSAPRESTRVAVMPTSRNGGSVRLGCRFSARGTSRPGLVRYQKPIAGTRPDGSAPQRLAGGWVRAHAR